MIGSFSAAVIAVFWSSLFWCVVPSAVRCRTVLLWLCFLIVGIHASGISIPLSLLMLLGWSLMWLASLTLHVYQIMRITINKLYFVPALERSKTRIKMHQSKLLKTNQSQRRIVLKRWSVTSRPHRLMKTSSMQSKRHDLHHKWPHCETKENTYYCTHNILL